MTKESRDAIARGELIPGATSSPPTDKPSIAKLMRLMSLEPGPYDACNGEGKRGGEDCEDCEGTGNALTVATRLLHTAAPVLLEIAAAALALGPELVYVRGTLSDRLRAALAGVKP